MAKNRLTHVVAQLRSLKFLTRSASTMTGVNALSAFAILVIVTFVASLFGVSVLRETYRSTFRAALQKPDDDDVVY